MILKHYISLPRTIHILCFGSLINRAGSFVLIFLTIYASEQLGFGVAFATACMGVFGLGTMFGALSGGYLADRIGRRAVILIALFGGAGMLLLIGHMTHRYWFMACVGVFALLSEMYRPATSAMIADVVASERRPHAFALMYISINLGFAIAPPLGGWLADYSYRWLFIGDALTMSVYGLVVAFFVRESMPTRVVESTDTAPRTGPAATVLRDTPYLLFCLATLLLAMVFMQGLSTLPIIIRQSGLSNQTFGWLMSINGMLIFALQLPITHWFGRFNPLAVVIVGGTLLALGFGVNIFGTGLMFFVLSIAIWTVGEMLHAPFSQAIATDLAPVALRARYLGVFSLSFAIAMTIGAPLGGVVLERYGAVFLWQCAVGLAVVAVLLYVAIYPLISRRIAVAK